MISDQYSSHFITITQNGAYRLPCIIPMSRSSIFNLLTIGYKSTQNIVPKRFAQCNYSYYVIQAHNHQHFAQPTHNLKYIIVQAPQPITTAGQFHSHQPIAAANMFHPPQPITAAHPNVLTCPS